MKLIPLGDKVVLRPMEAEETTAGGIVLPDAAPAVRSRQPAQKARSLAQARSKTSPGGFPSMHKSCLTKSTSHFDYLETSHGLFARF